MTEPNPNLPPIGQAYVYPPPVLGAQPVPALPYAQWTPAHHQQRPGILSAVSVISIVVASISFIASLVSGCQSGSAYMLSKMSNRMTATPTTVTTTSSGGTTWTSTGTTTVSSSSVSGVPTTLPTTDPTTAPTGTHALTASEVAGIVQKAQTFSQNKLNTAQINSLTTALQDPNQTLVTPGTAWSPVQRINVNPDGSAFLMLTGGFVTLDPQGQLQQNNIGMPSFKISGTTCLLAALDAVASLGLAVFLFVAAIIVMRSSPAGRKLHLIYAVLKIPLAIFGGVVLASLYTQFYVSVGSATLQTAGYIYATIFSAIGLIYPIALLIVMNTRGVREYYRG